MILEQMASATAGISSATSQSLPQDDKHIKSAEFGKAFASAPIGRILPPELQEMADDIKDMIVEIDAVLNKDETEGMTALEAFQHELEKAENPLAYWGERLDELKRLETRAENLRETASHFSDLKPDVEDLTQAMGPLKEEIARLDAMLESMKDELENPDNRGAATQVQTMPSAMIAQQTWNELATLSAKDDAELRDKGYA